MLPSQKASFRIGGTPGEWKLIFGEWAELGENLLPLEIYICAKCGRIKFFADEKSKHFLLGMTPMAYLKRCVKCLKEIPLAAEKCAYCGAKQP
jgi:hypothetical protein